MWKYTKKYDKNTKIKNKINIKRNKSKHKSRHLNIRKNIVKKYTKIQSGGAVTAPSVSSIRYCYEPEDIELEIVFLYTAGQTVPNFTANLESLFGNGNVSKEDDKEFTNDYIKYFFRLPNSDENNSKLESKDGLQDPDIYTSFNGKNFNGLNSFLNIEYFIRKNEIKMTIYKIKYFNNELIKILDGLRKNIYPKNTSDKSKYTVINYEYSKQIDLLNNNKKVLGIVETNYLVHEPIKNITIKDPIICIDANSTENKIDRYVKQSLGYQNLGASCFANSLIQLLKNIKNIEKTLDDYIKVYSSKAEKDEKYENILINLKKFMFESTINAGKFFIADNLRPILPELFPTNPNAQHDSHEFLQKLNIGFVNELKNHFLEFTYTKNLDFIKYKLQSNENRNVDIILNVIKDQKYANIQEILNNYSKGEDINSYFKINDTPPITFIKGIKQNCVYVTDENQYILIQLKLFITGKNNQFTGEKIHITITKIDDKICLPKLPDSVKDKLKDKEDIIESNNDFINSVELVNYELISVVVHLGGTGGGHYINYSRQIHNDGNLKWVCYNDTTVTFNESDNLILDKTPYLFLYKRI